jgi:hypothetical protein
MIGPLFWLAALAGYILASVWAFRAADQGKPMHLPIALMIALGILALVQS